MKTLNDYFIQYDNVIALDNSDYKKIREKRETIINELKSDENLMSFDVINLGSYKLKTGVKYKNNDYDIDCGIRLGIKKSDISNYSAHDCKLAVYDAIKNCRDKKFKTKCITVKYYRDDSPYFHVDFPVFAYDADEKTYYLADGKLNEDIKWVESKPEDLIEYLDLKDDNYKRVVRLLKKWNSKAFENSKKDTKAPSVALTIESRQWFEHNKYNDDITTLIEVLERISGLILADTIFKKNPYSNDNLYYKMNADSDCVNSFKDGLSNAISILKEAKECSKNSLYEAYKKLKKIFPDFPEPEKEKANESYGTNAKYA